MMRSLFVTPLAFLSLVMPVLAQATSQAPSGPSSQPEASGEAQVVDGIAAVVNGEVITVSQVRQIVGPRERLLRQQYTGEELQKQLQAVRKAALQDLIDRQLIVQSFKKEG